MEEQPFGQSKTCQEAATLRKTPKDKDRILARCKVDHLATASFSPKMNLTCYSSSFSPPKNHFLQKSTHLEKGLQLFRKYENTSSLRLPTITNQSQYQNLFNGQSHSQILRSTEKESWFWKSEWPQKLVSSYQKDFAKKTASNCNSPNKMRVNYNNLQVFDLHASPKELTQYQQQFKAFKIRPELSVLAKDHLMGKENSLAKPQLDLHRNYDSDFNVARVNELVSGKALKIKRQRND